MLTDLYLLPLLSGQKADLSHGRLSLSPYFAAPYVLPVLLAGVEGSIASDAKGQFTLNIAFGTLKLPAGGLSVDGVAYTKAVDMKGGDVISWGQ